MTMTPLHDTFAALGNATRFAIVERLLNEGELSAGDLLNVDEISPSAISRHFKILRKAGIVEQRIDKQRRLYTIRPESLQTVSAWFISHKDFWEKSMDRLEAALMKDIAK